MKLSIVVAATACAATAALLVPTVQPAEAAAGATAHETTYTFASMPDFLNNDLGDVRGEPGWDPGDPNSTNTVYEEAMAVVLDDLAADVPSGDVLVAGDMVEGRWGRDDANTGIFGPVGTRAEKTEALRRAANLYYPQWLQRFTARGLNVFGAVGDHDVGDDPWSGDAWMEWKRQKLHVFKARWADYFTESGTRFAERPIGSPAEQTAYATRLTPEVMLITVDQFQRTRRDVIFELDDVQLSWLRRVLKAAHADGVNFVMVQGHNPVVGPVRSLESSNGRYVGGRRSEFWRVMANNGVDLYLAGEVHDTTVQERQGLVQISHGGLFRRGRSMYLKGSVTAETLTLEAKHWQATTGPMDTPIWQTDTRKTIFEGVFYVPGPITDGQLVLNRAGDIVATSGLLEPGCC